MEIPDHPALEHLDVSARIRAPRHRDRLTWWREHVWLPVDRHEQLGPEAPAGIDVHAIVVQIGFVGDHSS
jgi:hypothetical protein